LSDFLKIAAIKGSQFASIHNVSDDQTLIPAVRIGWSINCQVFVEANVMKRYAVPIIVVLAVLAVTLSTFGRAADRAGQRGRMSEEERAKMRERFQNMSPEEQAKFRERMGGARGGSRRAMLSPEAQQKAIKAIEEQLVKLKAAAQVQIPQGGFRDLSEEDRNKIMTAFRDRRTALQTIVAQVAVLEGRRQPQGEGARFMIINTADLAPIQEAAAKEKAAETGKLLQGLIARGAGRGPGGRPGAGQRPQGGQRRQR